MTGEKNFIDFIIAAKDSPNLYDGFLDKSDPQALHEFFDDNMYVVSMEDCEKLIKAKAEFGIEGGRIPPAY